MINDLEQDDASGFIAIRIGDLLSSKVVSLDDYRNYRMLAELIAVGPDDVMVVDEGHELVDWELVDDLELESFPTTGSLALWRPDGSAA